MSYARRVQRGGASRRRTGAPSVWRAVLLLVVSYPSLATAATLRYEAPSECPAAETLRDEMERLLGVALADAADVDVLVQIELAANNGWRVLLTVRDRGAAEPRTRAISGHSCAEVADAAAVAAAIAIQARDPAPSPAAADSIAPRPLPKADIAPTPAQPARRTSPLARFGLGAALLFDTRSLPSLAVGMEASVLADFPAPGLRALAFGVCSAVRKSG